MNDFPIKGWPSEVLKPLATEIDVLVRLKSIREFYLGRTNDLEATKSRHGAQHIIPLYETTSLDNAIEVEDTLIRKFSHRKKCSNYNQHGGGGISSGYINYVYVAVWGNS